MFKSAVYYETSFLGEVEIFPQNANTGSWIREIRISHLSPPSERCPPLAVLHTVAACGVCFKMEAKSAPSNDSPLFTLHATLATENKTAVILLGEEELHLVAMASRKNSPNACFWGFVVPARLYDSSLVMLNLRCLGIVFDLDETLLVANTMRSFEDRIDALQRKINNETDAQRIATMVTEIKRYQEDKSILKQYVETDQVVENGNVFKVQPEMVPPLSDNHQLITRPVIRLHEKSIILTRVNPSIRDTSVLVRLRPAWEELRSYLTARGRKRFEVYVCTMAERDYALEMWRLLDPDSNLINSSKLLDRIVCVKSGSKKSLLNVFQDGICHPKMALVIDDRLKVWDEKDQPRVHVVPAFAPYYAPQAEVNSSIPVLHVARNVACNVRGGFFKEFDEGILPRFGEVLYEDEIKDFPPAPDVGHFLISEDDTTALNINRDQPGFDGMADGEVERRLKEGAPSVQPMVTNFGPRPVSSLQHVIPPSFGTTSLTAMQMMMPLPNIQVPPSVAAVRPLGPLSFSEPSFQGSPAREEGEVPESELDPDTRRRLLILQHGQDTREPTPQFPMTPPLHVSIPPVQSQGSWFPVEEEVKPRQQSRAHKEFSRESDVVRYRKRPRHPSFMHGGEISVPSDRVHHETRRLPMQLHNGGERLRPNNSLSNFNCFQGEEMPMGRNYSSHKDSQFEHRKDIVKQAESPAGVLQEIAMKCGNKMEFRSILCDTTELQFSIEVWFVGEKLGEGVGKTRKEAQHQAAEISLRNLADKYLSTAPAGLSTTYGDTGKENGPLSDSNSHGYQPCNRNGFLSVASTSEDPRTFDQRLENSGRQSSIISLKELCVMEGFNLDFQVDHPPSNGSISKGEVSAQVEIAGQILGRGVGATWEEAKFQAAAEALGTLRSMLGQFTQKRCSSPRILKYRTRHCPICAKNFVDDRYFASARPKPLPVISNKRLKPEISQTLNRLPSSGRYSKSEMPVP